MAGANIEALLRAGLQRLSLRELLKMADVASNPKYDSNPEQQGTALDSMVAFIEAGNKMLRQPRIVCVAPGACGGWHGI